MNTPLAAVCRSPAEYIRFFAHAWTAPSAPTPGRQQGVWYTCGVSRGVHLRRRLEPHHFSPVATVQHGGMRSRCVLVAHRALWRAARQKGSEPLESIIPLSGERSTQSRVRPFENRSLTAEFPSSPSEPFEAHILHMDQSSAEEIFRLAAVKVAAPISPAY